MKMKEKIIGVFCTSLILMQMAASAWAADIPALEAQIAQLKAEQEALRIERQTLLEQGKHLASEIDALKGDAKDGLGGTEKRKLTRKLQESIELSQRIEALDRQLNGLAEQIAQGTEQLKEAYEMAISALMRQIEQTDGAAKEELVAQAMTYLSAKLKLEEPVSYSSEATLMDPIEISTQDSPEEIREKADLISDMADKLKAELSQVDRTLKDLTREKKMRRKMQAFAEEISFFDEDVAQGRTVHPQEASKGQTLGPTDAEGVTGDKSRDDWSAGYPEPTEAPMVARTYAEPIYRIEVEELSLADLERGIDSLTVRKKHLEEASSALLKKAESFYNKAKRLE